MPDCCLCGKLNLCIYSMKSFEILATNIITNKDLVFVGFIVANIISSMYFVMCVSTCLEKASLLAKESVLTAKFIVTNEESDI